MKSILPRIPTRFAVTPLALNVLVVLFMLVAHNAIFWGRAWDSFGARPMSLALFVPAIVLATLFLTALGSLRFVQKPWLILLLLIGATGSYYGQALGATIDTEMLRNMMNTNPGEAGRLITPPMILHMTALGVLPAIAVALVPVRRGGFVREVLLWPVGVAACFLGTAVLLFADYQTFSSVFRNNRALMFSLQPGAPVNEAYRFARSTLRAANLTAAPLGRDATRGPRLAALDRPALAVVIVGETVRAANWGLNGYERDTTPELARRAVINYPDVTACGTSSAVSVPCMFSVLGGDDYSHEAMLATENLLDVLGHAGLDVQWWENNYTSYGVTERTGRFWLMDATVDAAACTGPECFDSVFFGPMRDLMDTITEDTVLVLHFVGSHGPSYFERYPPEFERFRPACQDHDFRRCSRDEIVNAYDNTIAFTDHVIAGLIDILQGAQDRVAAGLIYASDHGESLGENGLYLHGAPWFLAPPEQTQVPMVMWLSDPLAEALGTSRACLAERAALPTSHDVLFHTVLGMLDVRTEVADPALDLLAPCTAPG